MSVTDPKVWDDSGKLELWLRENFVDLAISHEARFEAGIEWTVVLNGPCEEVEETGLTMRHALMKAIERYEKTVRRAA